MKKLIAAAVVALFVAALAAPGAFAFGDCSGKSKQGSKTAEETKTGTSAA